MLDLMTLPADEAQRLAYAEGFTGTAALFARLDDLQRALGAATAELTDMQRRLYEADEQTHDAQIERDMAQSQADITQADFDALYVAVRAIARGDADPVAIACNALEART